MQTANVSSEGAISGIVAGIGSSPSPQSTEGSSEFKDIMQKTMDKPSTDNVAKRESKAGQRVKEKSSGSEEASAKEDKSEDDSDSLKSVGASDVPPEAAAIAAVPMFTPAIQLEQIDKSATASADTVISMQIPGPTAMQISAPATSTADMTTDQAAALFGSKQGAAEESAATTPDLASLTESANTGLDISSAQTAQDSSVDAIAKSAIAPKAADAQVDVIPDHMAQAMAGEVQGAEASGGESKVTANNKLKIEETKSGIETPMVTDDLALTSQESLDRIASKANADDQLSGQPRQSQDQGMQQNGTSTVASNAQTQVGESAMQAGAASIETNTVLDTDVSSSKMTSSKSVSAKNIEPADYAANISGVTVQSSMQTGSSVNKMDSVAQTASTSTRTVEFGKVVDQIVKSAKVYSFDGGTGMAIRLDPPHLGSLQMNISASQGTVTADIQTSSEATKNLLQSDLITLKQSLADAGMKVDTINVSVSDNQSSSFQSQGQFQGQYQGQTHQERSDLWRSSFSGGFGDYVPGTAEAQQTVLSARQSDGGHLNYLA